MRFPARLPVPVEEGLRIAQLGRSRLHAHTSPGNALPTVVHLTTTPISLAYLAGHLRAQSAAGHRVHVISSPGPGLEHFCSEAGAVAHPLPIPRQIRLGGDVRALVRLVRELRGIGPDVVHAHTPKAGLLGMAAARLLCVPVRVYHCHGLRYETTRGALRRILKLAERASCALATRVLTVGESMRRLMVAEGVCPEGKLQVLLAGSVGGVDAAGRFQPPSPEARLQARGESGIPADAVVLGFVGRLTREKGIAELYQAWRSLSGRKPHLHWLVVGPFDDADPVPLPVAEAMRADPRIHLAGLTWDTPRLFGAMDVVALPSHREGFPVVLLEAAAMALPVVASRATGCADAVVDGVTGTLVDVGDAATLERALARYLDDAELRRSHGEAARRRVLADFRPEPLHLAVQELYQRGLAGERRA